MNDELGRKLVLFLSTANNPKMLLNSLSICGRHFVVTGSIAVEFICFLNWLNFLLFVHSINFIINISTFNQRKKFKLGTQNVFC